MVEGKTTKRRDYGPVQLSEYLGLTRWQLERALADGLILPSDRSRGRWSASIAEDALARIDDIKAAAGSIPDVGVFRAAEELTKRLGITVTEDGVAELGRQGLIPPVGCFEKWTLYDGRAIEAFTNAGAAADACRSGYLQTADDSAGYLQIRRSDFDHLVRAGLLEPTDWCQGPYDRRNTFSVPLYRMGDLDEVARRDDIDWDAVRSARKGQRSPLAALPTASRKQKS
jgi:hypothetical protein